MTQKNQTEKIYQNESNQKPAGKFCQTGYNESGFE
jgi:hypothetical protein